MNRLSLATLSFAVSFSVSGCHARSSQSEAKIIGGLSPAANDAIAKAVAKVRGFTAVTQRKGSGVLIHKRVVISAWHVATAQTDNIDINGRRYIVDGDNVVFHPSAGGDDQETHDDLAVLFLSEDVPNVKPIPLVDPRSEYKIARTQGGRIVSSGTAMTTYGYGDTSLNEGDYGELHAIDVQPIAVLGDKGVVRLYSGKFGKGTTVGDSGGPTIAKQGQNPVLTALTLYGDDESSAETSGLDLRLYADWIRDTLAERGLTLPTPVAIEDGDGSVDGGSDDGASDDGASDDGASDDGASDGGDAPSCTTQGKLLARKHLAATDLVDLADIVVKSTRLVDMTSRFELYSIEVESPFSSETLRIKLSKSSCAKMSVEVISQ